MQHRILTPPTASARLGSSSRRRIVWSLVGLCGFILVIWMAAHDYSISLRSVSSSSRQKAQPSPLPPTSIVVDDANDDDLNVPLHDILKQIRNMRMLLVEAAHAPKIHTPLAAAGAASSSSGDGDSHHILELSADNANQNDNTKKNNKMSSTSAAAAAAATRSGVNNVTVVEHGTIFVSFAAFRDVECGPTLSDLFLKAAFPDRVFVGVVEQRDENDPAYCVAEELVRHCANLDAPTATPKTGRTDPSVVDREDSNGFWGRIVKKLGVASVRGHTNGDASDRRSLGRSPSSSLFGISFCPLHNIRIRRTRATEAKGPTFGRYIAASMYQGESFFMMIDSHNRFILEWDVLLVREYVTLVHIRREQQQKQQQALTRDDMETEMKKRSSSSASSVSASIIDPFNAVLSHYPAAYSSRSQVSQSTGKDMYTRFMCNGHFIESGIFRLDSETVRMPSKPIRQPFTAAGFLFADARILSDIPFDPYLDFLFDGEEILYSARLFTHGWDSYLPSINALYHFYGRPEAPKVWSVPHNLWWVHQKASQIRAMVMLNQTTDLQRYRTDDAAAYANPRVRRGMQKYGMGAARSLSEFWKFAHVNPHDKSTKGISSYCRDLLDSQERG